MDSISAIAPPQGPWAAGSDSSCDGKQHRVDAHRCGSMFLRSSSRSLWLNLLRRISGIFQGKPRDGPCGGHDGAECRTAVGLTNEIAAVRWCTRHGSRGRAARAQGAVLAARSTHFGLLLCDIACGLAASEASTEGLVVNVASGLVSLLCI